MAEPDLYPRFAEARLLEALSDTPVVLIHGARQCGKTTLARMAGEPQGFDYFNFDDSATLAAAEADPVGFVADLPERIILDEVQRAPSLLAAIKTAVDRRRVPGRFILTGSANVLFVPKLSDSLAGRMEILRLYPLSQCEVARNESHFLERLFAGSFETRSFERLGAELAERIAAGGYPAALARSSVRRRSAWLRGYSETLVSRDVRDLARVSSLDALSRLLTLACGQTARLVNVAGLGSPFQLSWPTIREYIDLLQRLFLLELLPAWHSNRLKRLVKAPKLHIGDTGLACALLGLSDADLARERGMLGQLVESFVFQELRRQASWHADEISFSHFRDKDGAEVDIVMERGVSEVVGVEIKAGATVTQTDFRGLRKLKEAVGDRFAAGVVLYDGETSVGFGDGLHALPIRMLWETTK